MRRLYYTIRVVRNEDGYYRTWSRTLRACLGEISTHRNLELELSYGVVSSQNGLELSNNIVFY